MKKLIRTFVLFIIGFFILNVNSYAQQIKRDVAISAYIYNFAKNVQWQNEESFDEFHFLVIGNDENIIRELKALSRNKRIRKKNIVVSTAETPGDISNVQLIFVTKENEGQLVKIYDLIEGKNILLVTDSYEDKRIIMVNFYDSKEGNLLFEINKANIINQNITIMPDMILLGGTVVDVAALYHEGEQSLRGLQKQLENMHSDLHKLEKDIAIKTKEVNENSDNLNSQTQKIQEQQKVLEAQNLLLKKREKELFIKTQQILSQQKVYELQKEELRNLALDVSAGNELLEKQQKEIENKKAELSIQSKTLEKQGSTINLQRNLMIWLIFFTVLIGLLVLAVYFAYRSKKKLNKALEIKVDERTKDLNETNKNLQLELAERKLAEEALQKSEERFRHTLDNMLEGCQIIGFDWRYHYVNDAVAGHGRKAKEMLLGQTMMEVYPDFENMPLYKVLSRCMKDRVSEHLINEFVYPDGSSAWFELSIQPVEEGIFILSYDITERHQIENRIRKLNEELEERVALRTEQLEDANKELEAFAYSVSHDLRAPLRAISGFSKILTEDYSEKLDSEGQRVCGVIQNETLRMGQLIDDLLAFSRLSRTSMEKVTANMTPMVQQICNEIRSFYPDREVNLQISDLCPVIIDVSLIRQVWINLISNAFKFSAKKDNIKIEIGCYKNPEEIIYFVKDNGSGFDMKYVNKLFGVFQRLHNINEFQGTGVGLAIVQRIIHRHGGQIWAESEVDKGAAFYFSLPDKKL